MGPMSVGQPVKKAMSAVYRVTSAVQVAIARHMPYKLVAT